MVSPSGRPLVLVAARVQVISVIFEQRLVEVRRAALTRAGGGAIRSVSGRNEDMGAIALDPVRIAPPGRRQILPERRAMGVRAHAMP